MVFYCFNVPTNVQIRLGVLKDMLKHIQNSVNSVYKLQLFTFISSYERGERGIRPKSYEAEVRYHEAVAEAIQN